MGHTRLLVSSKKASSSSVVPTSYEHRVKAIEEMIGGAFPDKKHSIKEFPKTPKGGDYFTHSVADPATDVTCSTLETLGDTHRANEWRESQGLPPTTLLVVPTVKTIDGQLVSTTLHQTGVLRGGEKHPPPRAGDFGDMKRYELEALPIDRLHLHGLDDWQYLARTFQNGGREDLAKRCYRRAELISG